MGCDNSTHPRTFWLFATLSTPAASAATQHPDFSILAARIAVSNLHKQTCDVFSDTITLLRNYIHPKVHNSAVAANVIKKLEAQPISLFVFDFGAFSSCLLLPPTTPTTRLASLPH